ncbi:MAG: hypothetical protein CM15mP47_5360 [Methanobacteriota archaeon]|nr:MAG: hypothetical protein CM15mP47_5360 [Euryarchaeota archaeon]
MFRSVDLIRVTKLLDATILSWNNLAVNDALVRNDAYSVFWRNKSLLANFST